MLTVTVYQTGCDSVYGVTIKDMLASTYQRGCDCVYSVTTKAVLRVTVYQSCDCVYGVTTKTVLTVIVYQRGYDCVYDKKSCAHSHCISGVIVFVVRQQKLHSQSLCIREGVIVFMLQQSCAHSDNVSDRV